MDESELSDVLDDDVTDVEYVAKDEEADEEADEEEEVEQAEPESQDVDRVKEKLVEAKKPLQMIGVQLLKDSDQTTTTSKRSMKRSSRMVEVLTVTFIYSYFQVNALWGINLSSC